MKNRHKTIEIENADDIDKWTDVINKVRPKIFCFDMDGVLVIKDQSFPKVELNTLSKSGVKTTIASSSGIANIVKRISENCGVATINCTKYFNSPLITNGGSYIVKTKDLYNGEAKQVLMYEKYINNSGCREIVNFIKNHWHGDGVLLFYPANKFSNKNSKYSPFKYLAYLNNKPVNISVGNYTEVKNLEDYLELFIELSASKFVIRGISQKAMSEIVRILKSNNLNITRNMDFKEVCIVPKNVSKKNALIVLWKKIFRLTDNLKDSLCFFGNDYNDEELLKYAKIGVIINSIPSISKKLVDIMSKSKRIGYTFIVNKKMVRLLIENAKTS